MADPNDRKTPRPEDDDDRPLTEAEMLGEGDGGQVLDDRVSESAPWPGDDDAS